MTRSVVVGASGAAMIAAQMCASAGGSPLWIPVGDDGAVPEAVGAGACGPVWSEAVTPRRRAWTGRALLDLPLDPFDAARAIGRRRFAADAFAAVFARIGAGDGSSLADAHRARLGRRWTARWCAGWLAARFGAAPEALSAAVASARPTGDRWVWPLADAERTTSDAVWRGGGDVGEALFVEAIEIADGRVVAIATEAGREHVDGLVFVDADPGEVDGWHPDGPKMPCDLWDETIVAYMADGPPQVIEIVGGPAWRVVVGDGRAWVFVGAHEPDIGQICNCSLGWAWPSAR